MKLFIHNPIFRLVAGLVQGVLVYLLILLINNTVEDVNKIFSTGELYVCIGLSYIAIESIRGTIVLFERKWGQLDFQQKIFLQFIITVAVSLALVGLAISAYYRLVIGFSMGTGEMYLFLFIFGITGSLYNILYISYKYLQLENKSRMEYEARMREKLESDFASFKSDINADLLYDSLENLILTIHHDADAAEEQIDYLAGIYRYSLINRHKELVTLSEELAAAEILVRLLGFRNENRLRVDISEDEAMNVLLIPGSLLVTMDTIVRNTLISKQSPLIMNLSVEEDDYLVLQHAVNDKLVLHEGSLLAYTRLQRSYSFFSEKPFVQIKAGGENFVKFPMVRIQTEPA